MSSISALSNAVVKKTISFRCFSYNKTRTRRSPSSLLLSQCAVSTRKLLTHPAFLLLGKPPEIPSSVLNYQPSDPAEVSPFSIEANSTPSEVIEDPPPYSPEPKPGIEFPKPPISPPLGPDIPLPKPNVVPPRTPPSPPDVVPPPPPDMPPRPPCPEIFPPPDVNPRPPGPEIVPPPGVPTPDIRPPPHGPIYMGHLIPSR